MPSITIRAWSSLASLGWKTLSQATRELGRGTEEDVDPRPDDDPDPARRDLDRTERSRQLVGAHLAARRRVDGRVLAAHAAITAISPAGRS